MAGHGVFAGRSHADALVGPRLNHNVVISTLPSEAEMLQTQSNGCRTSPTITRTQQLPRMRARVGYAAPRRAGAAAIIGTVRHGE